MRTLPILALLSVLVSCTSASRMVRAGGDALPSPPQADPSWTGNVALLVGGRALDEDDWAPVDEHGVLGVEVDLRPRHSALGIEIGAMGSAGYEDDFQNSGIDIEATLGELYVGPRLTLDLADDVAHLYVGGGFSVVSASAEGTLGFLTASDDDVSAAAYAHGGVYFSLSPNFQLGADVRSLFGSDLDLFGVPLDADYAQVALLIGVRW